MKQKTTIVFMGTPSIAVPTLKRLFAENKIQVKAVFTQPDKKIGRKQVLTASPIKETANKYGSPVYQPQNINTPENIKILKKIAPDYLIIMAYGQIISDEILKIPQLAPLNIHTSLLPKYRGAAPIQNAILNGDAETGITIQKIVAKLDAGDIVYQEKFSLKKDETSLSLSQKIAELAPEVLIKTISNHIKSVAQDEMKASYCQKIAKQDGKINFQTETANEIERKIRAFDPWPGTFCLLQGKRLKIIKAKISSDLQIKPGIVTKIGTTKVVVECQSGALELQKIQLEGKKSLNISDFLKGQPDFVGQTLE